MFPFVSDPFSSSLFAGLRQRSIRLDCNQNYVDLTYFSGFLSNFSLHIEAQKW